MSLNPFKIKSLKDPNFYAGYLTEIFEEEKGDLELGIVLKALRDVFEALGEPNMSAEEASLHLEKLDVCCRIMEARQFMLWLIG